MADIYVDLSLADGTANAGTELSPTSYRHACETLVAGGDDVWCKNVGDAQIDLGTNGSINVTAQGTRAAPIRVRAYSDTVGDGGIGKVRDSSATASPLMSFAANADHWQFEGLILEGGATAIDSSASTTDALTLIDCWLKDQTTEGIDTGSSGDTASHTFIRTVASGAPTGFNIDSRDAILIQCAAIDCSTAGFDVGASNHGAKLIGCLAHACGVGVDSNSQDLWAFQTVVNQCTTGIQMTADVRNFLVACGIAGCGTGINSTVAATEAILLGVGRFGNTAFLGANVSAVIDEGAVTGDPAFVDGSPVDPLDVDVSLGSGSAWLEAGLDFCRAFDAAAPINTVARNIGLPLAQALAGGGPAQDVIIPTKRRRTN